VSSENLELLVFGDTAIDNFYEVQWLPKVNEAADVSGGKRFYGGMGANTAVVASKLGLKTGLVSVIGTDADDYRNYMSSQGIKLYLKGIFGDTTKSMFFKTEKDQISFFYKGVTERLEELDPALEFGGKLPRKPQVVYMARTYLEMQKKAVKMYAKSHIVYNPGYGTFKFEKIPRNFKTIMNKSNTVILNHHEMAHLKKAGYNVKPKPGQVVIVTKGSKGASVSTKNTYVDIPTYDTEAVDASGAGDAFNAGYIAGYIKGLDTYESVKLGNAVASYIVQQWGCQTNIPDWDKSMRRYEKIR